MYNTIYPGYIKPYQTGNNRQIVNPKQDEEQSQSSSNAKNQRETYTETKNYPRNQFPNGEQVTIDYSKSKVNIAQIITDFKNTAKAIGTPEDISNEVMSYLDLIETQAQKDEPNKKIIQSNLKNASQILDNYITEALQKPSKVVENWIDALFLQNIDYKADSKALNPEFKVQIPNKKTKDEKDEQNDETDDNEDESESQTDEKQVISSSTPTSKPKTSIYIPEDTQLRKLFIQAKKYAEINYPQKALTAFKTTLAYAKEIEDTKAQSMVYYEVAKVYDKNDYLKEALKSYNKAIETTQDENIKIKSHMSMAQIYDDAVEFEPAIDHYFAAISFAGESENLNAQTKALSNLANMFCNRYDKQNTFSYIELATRMAQETQDNKTIGAVYSKSADLSEKLNEDFKALQYYRESTRYYAKTDSVKNIVKNYKKAAEIMLELGDTHKARKLFEKAYKKSHSLDDNDLKTEIATQLSLL